MSLDSLLAGVSDEMLMSLAEMIDLAPEPMLDLLGDRERLAVLRRVIRQARGAEADDERARSAAGA